MILRLGSWEKYHLKLTNKYIFTICESPEAPRNFSITNKGPSQKYIFTIVYSSTEGPRNNIHKNSMTVKKKVLEKNIP